MMLKKKKLEDKMAFVNWKGIRNLRYCKLKQNTVHGGWASNAWT